MRNYRPLIHFSPKKGWSNDPNGLYYHKGIWHLYFQHNPDDTKWGPMHWGHAISRDLLHWEELPIALYPDENGMIFSGSMVYDAENTSGFGITDPDTGETHFPLVAAFTSHQMPGHIEAQSIAYSLDDGKTFTKYEGNPVIQPPVVDGEILKDFRDPKVFWNKKKNCWTMLVAAYHCCQFFSSEDLKHWTKTGEFRHHFKEITNCWACTDLFSFSTEDGERWVFFASMENRPGEPESRTMYFVGSFDGDVFTAEETSEPLWLDFGCDNYAGVTFGGYEPPVMMGWGVTAVYANQVPTGANGFRGQMTCPRQLSLVKTREGYRLAAQPFGFEECRSYLIPFSAKGADLTGQESFGLRITGDCGEVILKNEQGECIRVKVTEDRITADRSQAGLKDFEEHYNSEQYLVRQTGRLQTGDISMEMLFDVSYLEIFADAGLETASLAVYPQAPYTELICTGHLQIEKLYQLK